MSTEPIAEGAVTSLCENGESVDSIHFGWDGPDEDEHATRIRKLSGHDGEYIRTSGLKKGKWVFNWRTWTALSWAEIAEVGIELGVEIPVGCLLENLTLIGIPDFSKLPPTSRLVFPVHKDRQAILAVWEENAPCRTVGQRLADYHGDPELAAKFVKAAQGKRGLMGFVLSTGFVQVGDWVKVYPPVS